MFEVSKIEKLTLVKAFDLLTVWVSHIKSDLVMFKVV